MKGYNWAFDFDPQFPAHLFPYTVCGTGDKMHWHRYYEIGLCTGGTGKFIYFGKEYPAQAGDIFISNNYESHVAVAEAGQRTQYIFLIFLPSFLSLAEGRGVGRDYISTFNYNPLSFINRIPGSRETAGRIAGLIRQGEALYSQKGPAYRMEVDIIVRRVLLELARFYSQKGGEEGPGAFIVSPKIRLAEEYINNNYNRSLTVSEVAAAAGLNASYFRHLFKAQVQVSFQEYITYLRLSQARTLLLGSDKTINKIIEEVGYSNISQFYRVFHQHYGMTPAQYRELTRTAAD